MEYLTSQTFIRSTLELISAATVSGYAVSRVTTHRLDPTATAVVLIATSAIATMLVSIYSFFNALSDTTDGRVTRDGTEPPSPATDALSAGRLWGRVLLFGCAGGAWGAGLTLLALAALNRRESHFLGLFVGVFASAGVAAITAGIASTALGIRFGMDVPASARIRSARVRAWRDLALPFAGFIALVTSAFSVLLFHDYHVGARFSSHVLTEREVLNDIIAQVILAAGLASFALSRAGNAEAKLGLVGFDDPERQTTTHPFGTQARVYVVLIILVVGGALTRFLLPAYPNLTETVIARSALASVTAFFCGGIAYTRGALNAKVAQR
jgi:hypothetical protein